MVQYLVDIRDAVWSVMKGMRITIKHIYKKPVTLQYPDERQVMPERFRGFVHNDMTKCDSCNICAKLCPIDCIYIESVGKGKDRMMSRYAIDYNKCIWCSLCTENCHTGSITMSHDYDHAVYDRRSLVYEFMDPTEQLIPCHRAKREELGWWVPPKEEKPKPAAAKKPATEKPAGENEPAAPADGAQAAETKPADAPAPDTAPDAAPGTPSDDKGEEK